MMLCMTTTWRLLTVSTKRYIRCCSLFTRPRQQTNGVSRCDLDESRIQYWNSSWTKRDRQGRMIGLIGDYNITVQPYNSCADRCADHGIVTVERRAVHWKVRWTQSFNVDYLPTYLPTSIRRDYDCSIYLMTRPNDWNTYWNHHEGINASRLSKS